MAIRRKRKNGEGSSVNRNLRSILVTVGAYSLGFITISLSTSFFHKAQLSGITPLPLFISSYRFSLVRLDWLMFCQGALAVCVYMSRWRTQTQWKYFRTFIIIHQMVYHNNTSSSTLEVGFNLSLLVLHVISTIHTVFLGTHSQFLRREMINLE